MSTDASSQTMSTQRPRRVVFGIHFSFFMSSLMVNRPMGEYGADTLRFVFIALHDGQL